MLKQEQELQIIIRGVGAERVQASVDGLEAQGVRCANNIDSAFGKITPTLGDIIQIAGQVQDFFISAANEAMDASEKFRMIHEIMGEMEGDLKEWSSTSSAAITSATVDVEAYAAELFQLSENMGLNKKQAFELSTEFTDLAADIASFRDKNPEEVFNAISRAIQGNYDGLKSLGFRLDQTYLKQVALNKGLWDGKGNLEGAAKAMAVYTAVMDQAAPVLGDVERSMDSMPTLLLRIEKQLKDYRIEVGNALIENDGFVRTLQNIEEIIENLSDPEKMDRLNRMATDIGEIAAGITEIGAGLSDSGVSDFLNRLQAALDATTILAEVFRDIRAIMAYMVGDMIGVKEILKDSVWTEVFGTEGLLATGLEESEAKLAAIAEKTPKIASDMQESAEAAGDFAGAMEAAGKQTEKLKKASAVLLDASKGAQDYFNQVELRLEAEKKRMEELWEMQRARDSEEESSREQTRTSIIRLYESSDSAFQQWLEKQYPGLRQWVEWYRLGADDIERRINLMYQNIQAKNKRIIEAMGGNVASVGGGGTTDATLDTGGGSGTAGGSGSATAGGAAGGGTYTGSHDLGEGHWGAGHMGGASMTVTRQASPEAVRAARIRANEALGYAKFDVTLADLPELTGRAVASAITETMRRPSFQSSLGALGVG